MREMTSLSAKIMHWLVMERILESSESLHSSPGHFQHFRHYIEKPPVPAAHLSVIASW